MPFPNSQTGTRVPSSPILVATTSNINVPANAKFLNAYIIAGGGSGAVFLGNVGGTCDGAGGGTGGGTFIQVDLSKWKWEADLSSKSDTLILGVTVGAGGTARSSAAAGTLTGNTGGSTTLTLTGGLSVTVTGGAGGGSSGSSAGGTYGTLATANRFTTPNAALINSAVSLRPLIAQPTTYSSGTFSGDVLAAGGSVVSNVGSEVGNNGGSLPSTQLVTWWMRQAGLAPGTGGTGAKITSSGKAAGGGAAGFGGNGGNGAVLNTVGAVTAGSGTGYGSGGGGACGITGSTVTSGAGAPGCAVIVFELEV